MALTEAAREQMAANQARAARSQAERAATELANALDDLHPWDRLFLARRDSRDQFRHGLYRRADGCDLTLLEIVTFSPTSDPDGCYACGALPEGRWAAKQITVDVDEVTEVRRPDTNTRLRVARQLWRVASEPGADQGWARTLAGWALELTRPS